MSKNCITAFLEFNLAGMKWNGVKSEDKMRAGSFWTGLNRNPIKVSVAKADIDKQNHGLINLTHIEPSFAHCNKESEQSIYSEEDGKCNYWKTPVCHVGIKA